jgi:hypothetical protein
MAAASVKTSVAASMAASVAASVEASAARLSTEMQALMGLHVGSTCHILANQDSFPEQYFCAASMLWGLDHFA